jgi:hypothetical protein
MAMFQRTITQQINDGLGKPGTAMILYGPRQAGKTTLVNRLLKELPDAIVFIGDDLYTQSLLARHELEHLKRIVGSATTIFIDEAQRIENIGLTIKLLVDHLPLTVIASGSASFELADRLSEPLTGRARTFHLHPLSWEEVAVKYRITAPETAMEDILRFGMYPRVHCLESNQEKEEYLYNYINSYLYRDLLQFDQIKKPKKVVDLLTLLAHQIGREVAISELSKSLSLSQKTVENYLDILEKMFVLVDIRGFSRNLRKEVTKTSRYYFVDVGVRNALIRSFVPLSVRDDVGELFENWFVMERIKLANNHRRFTGFYFWRTYDQHEIDLVEDLDGRLMGFECKWSPKSREKAPKDWLQNYPDAGFEVVSRVNWTGFLED